MLIGFRPEPKFFPVIEHDERFVAGRRRVLAQDAERLAGIFKRDGIAQILTDGQHLQHRALLLA